jgi:hypothetical protein
MAEKFGAGSVNAFLRQGIKELRNGLYTGSNIATNNEYGVWGSPTPGEIAVEREGGSVQQDGSILKSVIQKASEERDVSSKVMEREPER